MADLPATNNTGLSAADLMAKSRMGLRDFFQQKSIRSLTNVLVPSALAAVLFPVFGPAIAGGAAAVAIQNGLKLLGISLSAGTIEKILKPLEGQPVDENDIQSVLQDLLPSDEQVNDEAARALVTLVPEVKEAALTNSKLNQEWLGSSLESSLADQGWVMARIARRFYDLIKLDSAALGAEQNHLLAVWPEVSQEVTASEGSEIRHIDQSAEGGGVQVTQRVRASDQSTIENVKQNIRLT